MASLIGKQVKTIETRNWPTFYRGELYIHAGLAKVPTKDERIKRLTSYLDGKPFMYGMIIVKCKLVDCVYIDEEFAAKTCKENPLNYDCGDYTVGRYAWILKDVEYINSIPAVGHLSIWNYNSES